MTPEESVTVTTTMDAVPSSEPALKVNHMDTPGPAGRSTCASVSVLTLPVLHPRRALVTTTTAAHTLGAHSGT